MAFASISTGKATNYTIAIIASPIACYRFPGVLLLDLGTSPTPVHAWRLDLRITAWSEQDSTTGLWNGRYRILDQKGTVAYESFVEPLDDENKAQEAASAKAREWVDGQ